MTSSYTSRGGKLPFSLKVLVSYGTSKFLRTLIKNVEKIGQFLSQFALGDLLGPLGPADYRLSF